jgi:hypothetical protein
MGIFNFNHIILVNQNQFRGHIMLQAQNISVFFKFHLIVGAKDSVAVSIITVVLSLATWLVANENGKCPVSGSVQDGA